MLKVREFIRSLELGGSLEERKTTHDMKRMLEGQPGSLGSAVNKQFLLR